MRPVAHFGGSISLGARGRADYFECAGCLRYTDPWNRTPVDDLILHIAKGVGPRQLSQPRIAGCPAGTHHLWEHRGAPHAVDIPILSTYSNPESTQEKKHALTRVGDLIVTMAKMNLLFVTAAVAFPFLARRRPHD